MLVDEFWNYFRNSSLQFISVKEKRMSTRSNASPLLERVNLEDVLIPAGRAEVSMGERTVLLPYGDTPRWMTGWRIAAVLPIGHRFAPTDAYALIAPMIAVQPHGEPGNIPLPNGAGNLFPCGTYFISICRDLIRRRWSTDVFHMGYTWGPGQRVFNASLIVR